MRLLSRRFRRTTQIAGMMLAVLVGLAVGRLGYTPSHFMLVVAALLWILAQLHSRSLLTMMLALLFALSCGMARGAVYAYQLAAYQAYDHKTTFVVRVLSDAVYGKNSQLSFDASDVVAEDGHKLPGKIAVSGFGANAIFTGDKLEVAGKLRPDTGSYAGRMSFGRIVVLSHHQTPIDELRRRFAAGLASALPEPAAPFALGLLIGQRATLSDQVKQDLLMVGLTHIIAVSGYNMTIMLRASKNLFAGRSKRLSTAFSVFLVVTFLLITGNSASIVRAAIVSMLSILTGYYGRQIKPLNLILIAAAVTAWWQPSYVWGDISWYLSFLAFYGVIVLGPLIVARLPFRLKERTIAQIIIESLCAEALTLPVVLFTFGQMSRVALIGNLIIAVAVPPAMLLSLIAGLAGMFIPQLAGWLSWPANLVLTYMLDVAHILASLPHVFVENIGLSGLQMAMLYMLIVLVTWLLWFKSRYKNGIITDIT